MEIKGLAIETAKKAGRLLKERLGDSGPITFKGAVDIVTEMDRRSEDLIMNEIKKFFPEHGILTEESAEIKALSPYRWIIDPLDGTTNYAHGFPVFCVSIAVENAGTVVLGVVYNPMLDELFTAEKDEGALLNGKKISVSPVKSLDRSLLATGFPYDIRKSTETNLDHFSNFAVRGQAIRRAGAAALDMSYVACGRFDGFWEMKLKPWDVAAAGLIVKEAGGVLSDFKGNAFSIHGNETLATNGLIHEEMLRVLAKK